MNIRVIGKLLIFSLSIILLTSKSIFAQDSFNSIEELVGNKVVIYDASGLLNKCGPYLYLEQNGKLKLVKDVTQYSLTFDNGQFYDVKSIEYVKNKKYLLLSKGGLEYYIIIDTKKDYLGNIRSYSYWENKFEFYRDEYQFCQIPGADTNTHPCNQYKEISWVGFEMPVSYASDVQFDISESDLSVDGKLNGNSVERSLPSKAIQQNATKYINKEKYKILVAKYIKRKEQEHLDSIADMRPIIAKVRHTYDAKNTYKKVNVTFNDDDDNEIRLYSAHTYGILKPTYSGYSLCNDLTFFESDLQFFSQSDVNYLKRRGSDGEAIRRKVAKESDYEYTMNKIDSLNAEMDKISHKLQTVFSFYEKKKILIIGQEYAYGDYEQFGLSFKIYNCYAKQIKYVEIKMVPYNSVDDVQTDDLGRGTKEVRCIGPIEPKESVTYEFDELWWDKRDVIKRVDVVRVKIIFRDNTSETFSSKAQVDAHRSSSYSFSEMGITE